MRNLPTLVLGCIWLYIGFHVMIRRRAQARRFYRYVQNIHWLQALTQKRIEVGILVAGALFLVYGLSNIIQAFR